MNKSILISGCSWATGCGLPEEKNNPRIWPNQLVNEVWPGADITNIAQAGNNNDTIFFMTAEEILKNRYDCVIVEWSETTRLNYNIGLELYKTLSRCVPDYDINLVNQETIKGDWLYKNIKQNIVKISNEHWFILNMVRYLNILIQLQKPYGEIFFVNGGGCWPDGYFNRHDFWADSDLYTKEEILQMHFRDDKDIAQLYSKIHDDYENAGGINEGRWLNLYNSLHASKIDVVSDTDFHPGMLSQDKFATEFILKIKNITKSTNLNTNSIRI